MRSATAVGVLVVVATLAGCGCDPPPPGMGQVQVTNASWTRTLTRVRISDWRGYVVLWDDPDLPGREEEDDGWFSHDVACYDLLPSDYVVEARWENGVERTFAFAIADGEVTEVSARP